MLIEGVDKAMANFTKAACTEIKALKTLVPDCETVVVAAADLIGAPGNTWKTARAKMFDFMKQVGSLKTLVSA